MKLRINRSKKNKEVFETYVFAAQSLVGCSDIVYNADVKQHQYNIVDHAKFAESGLGLFADRDYELNECIGLYGGDLVFKKVYQDTGYSIRWNPNSRYVIDAKGGLGHRFYFGWHFVNDSEKSEDANVLIDDEMLVYCIVPKIKLGDEFKFWYGISELDKVNRKKKGVKKRKL